MPLIEVKLYDTRVADQAQVQSIIEKLTDALCAVIGDEMRGHVWCIVEGVPKTQWGIGGAPS